MKHIKLFEEKEINHRIVKVMQDVQDGLFHHFDKSAIEGDCLYVEDKMTKQVFKLEFSIAIDKKL